MRAAVYTSFGGPDGVEIRTLDEPRCDPTSAVVDVEAVGINYHELRMLFGGTSWLDDDDLPYVAGADLAGVVSEVGGEVNAVSEGDRVVRYPIETCGTCRFCRDGPQNRCPELSIVHGGFAERAAVDPDRLVVLPDDVSFVQAATLPVAYLTAWFMARRADVTAGDLVLVPGATGGVGVAAIQLLDALGATSIGTTTNASKLSKLEALGADHVLQVRTPDELGERVAAVGDPDAALNHLGGEYVQAGLSVLRQGGTMAVCGRTTGDRSEIHIRDLYLNHRSLVGSTVGTQPDLERLVGLVASGEFDPVVDREFPLEDVADALERLDAREHLGKLVLRP